MHDKWGRDEERTGGTTLDLVRRQGWGDTWQRWWGGVKIGNNRETLAQSSASPGDATPQPHASPVLHLGVMHTAHYGCDVALYSWCTVLVWCVMCVEKCKLGLECGVIYAARDAVDSVCCLIHLRCTVWMGRPVQVLPHSTHLTARFGCDVIFR